MRKGPLSEMHKYISSEMKKEKKRGRPEAENNKTDCLR